MGFYSMDFLADSLNNEASLDDFTKFDLNGDGTITGDDCPFPTGSTEAKLWWKNVQEVFVKSQITEEMKTQYGDKVVGAYKGMPLVPGEAGKGQGDFDFLVDKIRVTQGLSYSAAVKIAGKVKGMIYG